MNKGYNESEFIKLSEIIKPTMLRIIPKDALNQSYARREIKTLIQHRFDEDEYGAILADDNLLKKFPPTDGYFNYQKAMISFYEWKNKVLVELDNGFESFTYFIEIEELGDLLANCLRPN